MILLSSFAKSKFITIPKYSAAVYQPKGFDYPKATWADIRLSNGKWIRPREFIHWQKPLTGYFACLFALYLERIDEIEEWIDKRPSVALLCWCPYERAAQRQIKEHGSYVCHLGVVEAFLKHIQVEVEIDKDRKKNMVRFF